MKGKGLFAALIFTTGTLLAGVGQINAHATVGETVTYTGDQVKVEVGAETTTDSYYNIGKGWNKFTGKFLDVTSIVSIKDVTIKWDADANHSAGVKDITLTKRPANKAVKDGAVKVDFAKSTFTVDSTLEYKVFGSDWKDGAADMDISELDGGNTVTFRVKANNAPASLSSTFVIPARPAAPALKLDTNNDIAGMMAKYEFREMDKDGKFPDKWTTGTGTKATPQKITVPAYATDAKSITVEVRTAGTDKALASQIKTITVYPQAKQPSATNTAKAALDKKLTFEQVGLEYKVAEYAENIPGAKAIVGKEGKWTKIAVAKDATKSELDLTKVAVVAKGSTAKSLKITVRAAAVLETTKKAGTGTEPVPGTSASELYSFSVKPVQAAPTATEVKADFTTGKFGFTDTVAAKYEWAPTTATATTMPAAEDWESFTNNAIPADMISETADTYVLIRAIGAVADTDDAALMTSAAMKVKIPKTPIAPTVKAPATAVKWAATKAAGGTGTQFKLSSGGTYKDYTDADFQAVLSGTSDIDVTFRKKATVSMPVSKEIVVKFKYAAPPAAPTGLSDGKGKIAGTTNSMEYATKGTALDATSGWTICEASNTAITTPGDYIVRVKATATQLAGATTEVKVTAAE